MIRTLIILCVAVLPAQLFAQASSGTAKPHILLVMADDLGWMDLHCQGNLVLRTPQLDRLAQQGVRFTNAYAASPGDQLAARNLVARPGILGSGLKDPHCD